MAESEFWRKDLVPDRVDENTVASKQHPDRPWERITVYRDDQALDPTEGHEGAAVTDPDLWARLVQQRRAWEAGEVYRIGLDFFVPTGTKIKVKSPEETSFLVGEWYQKDVITEQYLTLVDETPEDIAAEHWTGWDLPGQERNE